MSHHEAAAEYVGEATLVAGGRTIPVEVTLRGAFQPLDGRFHWYGRIARSDDVDAVGSGSEVVLRTGHGAAEARLSDVDPWGRFRSSGTGTPPC